MSEYRRFELEAVTSTNDEAMMRLRDGVAAPFVVTARSQSGGRGRQGRAWASPPGNLYMSLALRDPSAAERTPQLGFVAGVALAETLRRRLQGDRRLQLKWPNDVLHDGAKLAGMLLEGSALADGGLGCVIGIGVNCRSHPDDLAYAATNLCKAGDPDPDSRSLLAEFLERFDISIKIWDQGAGFPAIRRQWLGFAAGLGERIGVTTPRHRLEGIFRDLDPTGRLLLDAGSGTVAIEAGDVFFPALAADP